MVGHVALISLVMVLALIGLLAWVVTTFLPMPGNIKTLIIVVCGVVAVLYALSAFGLLNHVQSLRVPTVN